MAVRPSPRSKMSRLAFLAALVLAVGFLPTGAFGAAAPPPGDHSDEDTSSTSATRPTRQGRLPERWRDGLPDRGRPSAAHRHVGTHGRHPGRQQRVVIGQV